MLTSLRNLAFDLYFSARGLRRSPGFALTAILTLALGIGAVTSVFSVVNSVLLQPFAFPDPGRLVVLRESVSAFNNQAFPVNYHHFLNWKTNSKTLAGAAIFNNQTFSVSTGSDHPVIVGGLKVSPSFFSVLGVQPTLGRNFLTEEAIDGRDKVVILSFDAWQRYFNADPSAIGQKLLLGGIPHTVVGILPRNFAFPHMSELQGAASQAAALPDEIFQPFTPSPQQSNDSGDYDFLCIARLRPGFTLAQAQSELDNLQRAFALHAKLAGTLSILVESLSQEVVGKTSTALWLLLAAVAAVLLIACVNLANLQLARAVAREHEVALRAALGADRRRLLWTALSDSLVLALAGGILGILFAFIGVRLFIAAAPGNLPRLAETHVSLPVLAAASALSILTALLFGAMPALRSLRVDPQSALHSQSTRVANTREGQRTRSLLLAIEVAFTVVLLVVTGLLVRSFNHVVGQQRGFESAHVTLVQVDLFNPLYGDNMDKAVSTRAAFIDRAIASLSSLPGVQAVGVTSAMPMAGETWIDGIFRPDHPLPSAEIRTANMRMVSPGYVDALRIPVLEGRNLSAADRDHPTNALISLEAARTIWPGEDPLGKTFNTRNEEEYTVVGVVADARVNNLKKTAAMVYVPYWGMPLWRQHFLIRSTAPTESLAPAIHRAIWQIDPQVPIPTLESLDSQVGQSVATDRFQTILFATFGVAALFLALLGIYGVLAYSVSLRRHEFGIRIALGSGRSAIMALVLRQAAIPVFAGIAAGVALAALATRSLESILYETKAADPLSIAASIAILLVTAALAALLPARRATHVDPMIALRND